ncbi:putative late blight resistance protein-like protein R1B-17 [Forsythia ovata]|uniref:Late blight resistance protein-like protein R1B-17 n=1 Tax=Forsythia ovata TaxID=205694 RepID=A0ABD1WPV1_9LAMI
MDLSIQSLDDSSSEQGDELGYRVARFISIPLEYISYMSEYMLESPVIYTSQSLETLPKPRNLKDLDETRKLFQELISDELKLFFKVPNQQIMSNSTHTLNANQVVAFINFLLLMVEAIIWLDPDFIACIKGSVEILRTELGFLIAFLGDTAMHLQPAKNILIDIEAVVNEVGSFFYSFLFTGSVFMMIHEEEETNSAITGMEAVLNEVRSFLQTTSELEETNNSMTDIKPLVNEVGSFLVPEIGILDLTLSDLLLKFELLKTKIKEHCITVSTMPSDMAPNTSLVSLFIVESVLDDLMHLINNNSDRIVGVDDQIVMLHEELMLLGSSVTNIAVQQEAEHEELLIRTRDIAYEIEYVINSTPHVWYLTLRLPQLFEKIQLIRMSIHEIKNKIETAGMPEVAKYPVGQVSSQSKEPLIKEDIVVGFDNVAIEIADQLVRGTEQLQIISIFGMPGLGKTTLANKVYNSPSVVKHFYARARCVVSQRYNKKDILIAILSSINNLKKEKIVIMDNESLAENLYKSLIGRRYLVVMDDIWDIEVWDDLKRYFPDDRIGSRILFTTRNKEVGLKGVTNALPFLTKDECWELLQRKVFQDKNCPQELVDIGKQIATNCDGLPLAVVVIAGVLANMEKKEHLWQKVARNLSLHIFQTLDKSNQIFELSYKYLPLHLRPCFLYFGAFEEDKDIPVRKLISLWVAEGFVKKEELKSLEDVALGYLMKLIDRSLILVAKRRFDGGVKTCKIHDLLREMCLRIAEENNFLKVVKLYDDPPQFLSQVSKNQRHHCLSIDYGLSPICSLPFGLHVRSLLCAFAKSTSVPGSLKILRVLDLYHDPDVFDGIGFEHLIHLRYLAITIEVDILPSMESFHKLEYLYVDNTSAVEIPDVLLIMVSLRQMHFMGRAYISASLCRQATKDESFQINSNLHSISVLLIRSKKDVKVLKCFPNLRRLKVEFKSSFNYSFDLLNQLESLKFSNYKRCSNLINLPSNLKKLTLVGVHVSPEQMEIVGKLQYLEVLKLQEVDFEGEQWDTSEGEFPQLKCLKLNQVEIAEWNTSRDHFPRLQRLVLELCYLLKMIPPSLGDIPTLDMIEVHGCAKAIIKSAKKIQEEQEENGNEELQDKQPLAVLGDNLDGIQALLD